MPRFLSPNFCEKPRSLRLLQLVNYLQRLQTDTTDTINTTDTFARFDDIYTPYMRLIPSTLSRPQHPQYLQQ